MNLLSILWLSPQNQRADMAQNMGSTSNINSFIFWFKIQIETPAEKLISCPVEYNVDHRPWDPAQVDYE